jgi:hypothetical protein
VYGDGAAQLCGCGGIAGGFSFSSAGLSSFRASSPKVFPKTVTGSHPPPFQKPDSVPSGLTWLAMLSDIRTPEHAGLSGLTFQT